MNINKIIICGILGISTMLACASGHQIPKDSYLNPALAEQVGDSVAVVLTFPDEVTYYALQNEGGEVAPSPGYYRPKAGKRVYNEEIAVLQFLLTNNTELFLPAAGEMRVSAPYMPFDEFVFRKGKNEVSLLVSESDMSWSVVKDGKELKNYTYQDVRAVKRLLEKISSRP